MIFPGFARGIRSIWENDEASQSLYLQNIGEETRKLPLEAFRLFNAFFVPNDRYVSLYFGAECQQLQYEIYRVDGTCTMNNCIVFPFYNLLGQIIGWVSYKPFVRMTALEANSWDVHYYDYPSTRVLSKGHYVFVKPSVYESALQDGYIVITDGVFDTVSHVFNGVHACSLLGSSFTDALAFYFRFIPKIFVSIDNDDAGLSLYRDIQRYFPHARKVRQVIGKDSDDILKSEYKEAYLRELRAGIARDMDVVFRPKFRLG